MLIAILILVCFLAACQFAGLLGLSNAHLRADASKRIARELHELQKED